VINGIEEFEVIQDLIINRLWPEIDGKISSSNRVVANGEYREFPNGTYDSDYDWFFQSRVVEDVISNVDSWRIDAIKDEKTLLGFFEEMLLILDQEIETSSNS
jgi:hypothetical protein